MSQLFSPSDLDAIEAAVHAAEEETGGEIVPHIVGACDSYGEVAWKGATLGVFVVLALAYLWHMAAGYWESSLLWWSILPALGGAFLGFLLAHVPSIKRWLIDEATIDDYVAAAAHRVFLDSEVFATRDRTGILLFVALFERRVLVLGDRGIHEKVQPEAWQGIVATAVNGIRAGAPTAALVEAVGACGSLLAERGVARRTDDRNELPDRPEVENAP